MGDFIIGDDKEEGRREQSRKNTDQVKAGNEIFIIASDDILFIEKRDKISLLHTGSNVYRAQQTLSELEDKLGDNFSRVHRAFIVNLNKVSRIEEVSNRSYEVGFAGYDKTAL